MSNDHGRPTGDPISPEEELLDALDRYESGDDAALETVRGLHHGGFDEATLALGALLMSNDQLDEGVAVFRDAIERKLDGARAAYADCLSEVDGAEAEAELHYRKAIDEGSVDASIGLAELLRTGGRRSEAIELLAAVAAQDIDADQRCDLADVLSEIPGHREETERQYRLAITAGSAEALANLAIELKAWGRVEEAVELLESAIPDGTLDLTRLFANTLRLLPGRELEADAWYRSAIDGGDTGALNAFAAHLHDSGRTTEAKALLAAAAEEPDRSEARSDLIVMTAEVGGEAEAAALFDGWEDGFSLDEIVDLGAFLRTADAVELAERVLRRAIAEGDADSANQLGKMYEEHGRADEAVAFYERELAAGNSAVRVNLAELLSRDSATRDQAEALFRAMIEDDTFEAYNNYGVFLAEGGDTEAAMRWYREGIDRGDGFAMRNLALALSEEGRRDEAIAMMQQAVDRGADNGWVDLCEWAVDAGDAEAAEFAAQMAIETEAEHVYSNVPLAMEDIWPWERREALMREGVIRGDHHAAFNLGVELSDRGLYDEAAEAYATAIELGSVMAMHNLGNLWAEQGRHQEARVLLERALKLGDELAAEGLSELDAAGDGA